MINKILLIPALSLALLSYSPAEENSDTSKPSTEMVSCSGTITSFMKDPTPEQLMLHGCVWFEKTGNRGNDATWVKITSPEEFKGITHILITNDENLESPFGKVGDEIQFSALRESLESDQRWFASNSSTVSGEK